MKRCYRFNVGDIINDREILKYTTNKRNQSAYYTICKKCGKIQNVDDYRIDKTRCPICCNQSVATGVNDVNTTNPELVKYFKNKEDSYGVTYGSKKKIVSVCPICGNEKICMVKDLKNYSCPKCGDGFSFPEKFIYSLLNQLNIEFEYQKSLGYVISKRPLRYDFYFEINNNKYIIEADGGFHFRSGYDDILKSKERDKLKDSLAKDNNIEVIRIDCEKSDMDYIKNNIIKSKLNKLFDLDDINWGDCTKFASNTSMVEYIANLWNLYYEWSKVKQFSKFSTYSITKYLKMANDIGLIKYDGKLIIKEKIRKIGLKNGITTQCLENGIIFKSASECAQEMSNITGLKFYQSNIQKVCSGKRKHCNGYHFKYV